MSVPRCQRTLRRAATVEGFGYFSGRDVRIEFRPAPVGAGVTFVRRDLGNAPHIGVSPALRIDVPRRTTLERHGVRVEMVEHILATLAGLRIDNCDLAVDAAEMPGCDGSALPFVEALDAAGVVEQEAPVRQIRVEQAIRVGDSNSWIEARPTRGAGLSIAFELDYGSHTTIGRQLFAVAVSPESFRTELAPCRTFLLEEVARAMVAQGIGRRVTPQNLLIFGPAGPIDNQLRFDNECARHKVLDVVGDLALTGCEIVADVVAYRSGHKLHAELAARLLKQAEISSDQRLAAGVRLAS
jgi:UDP-3-O-acyl N-acetylglucosamine deacetylase